MEKLNMNYKIMVEYDDGTYETFRALEVAGPEKRYKIFKSSTDKLTEIYSIDRIDKTDYDLFNVLRDFIETIEQTRDVSNYTLSKI